jgi:hypothetical protein
MLLLLVAENLKTVVFGRHPIIHNMRNKFCENRLNVQSLGVRADPQTHTHTHTHTYTYTQIIAISNAYFSFFAK